VGSVGVSPPAQRISSPRLIRTEALVPVFSAANWTDPNSPAPVSSSISSQPAWATTARIAMVVRVAAEATD
jgi:hypothetical protein